MRLLRDDRGCKQTFSPTVPLQSGAHNLRSAGLGRDNGRHQILKGGGVERGQLPGNEPNRPTVACVVFTVQQLKFKPVLGQRQDYGVLDLAVAATDCSCHPHWHFDLLNAVTDICGLPVPHKAHLVAHSLGMLGGPPRR